MAIDYTYMQEATEIKWRKTIVGHDAIVYEKKLDPIIIKRMPKQDDTFIDVTLTKLIIFRLRQRLSKLRQFLPAK